MVNVVFAGRRCYTIDRLGMDDQDDCGKDREQEFRHDPIEPEQAPVHLWSLSVTFRFGSRRGESRAFVPRQRASST